MRSVFETAAFKRDFKREEKGKYRSVIAAEELADIIELLANDTPLPKKYSDHALTGKWTDYRECHIRPDFLLIYLKSNDNTTKLRNRSDNVDQSRRKHTLFEKRIAKVSHMHLQEIICIYYDILYADSQAQAFF